MANWPWGHCDAITYSALMPTWCSGSARIADNDLVQVQFLVSVLEARFAWLLLISEVDMIEMTPYQREILFALNRLGKHVYEGTVPSKERKRRRAANRVARASRRNNRA